MFNKAIFPEFSAYVEKHDIVCLTETFITELDIDPTNNIDTTLIQGYTICHKHRNSRKASGGLSICIKNSIKPYISIVQNDNEDSIWCKISTELTTLDQCMYLACVYISPEGSPYSNAGCFNVLEHEIVSFNQKSDYVIVVGDFNAKTSIKPDFLYHDVNDDNTDTGVPEACISLVPVENILDHLGLPHTRITKDKNASNNWGNRLLECCLNSRMLICNGRFGPPSSESTTTYDSVLEYAICTPELLYHVSSFHVLDFSNLLSDLHKGICLELSCNNTPVIPLSENVITNQPVQSTETTCNVKRVGSWEEEKEDVFRANLNITDLNSLNTMLQNIDTNADLLVQIDAATESINTLFYETGTKTFGEKSSRPKRKRKKPKEHKPWYNTMCRNKRVIFNQARKKFKIPRAPLEDDFVKMLGRQYKNAMLHAHMTYSDKVRHDIRVLRKMKNNRDYWRYCKTKKETPPGKNIDFKKFTNFFETLNIDSDKQECNRIHEYVQNAELDMDITEFEIRSAIRKLKNGKAAGADHIENTWIKATQNIMMPTYVTYFNIIYSTATIPSEWAKGIIKPIYKGKGDSNEPDNYRPITILSCLGKLFTCILNTRINTYIEKKKLLGGEQLGFRENHSTMDGVFILHVLSQIMKATKTSLYCAFIDLKKCFPSIWRDGLWYKLDQMRIGTKTTNVIHALYENVKSCIMMYTANNDGNVTLNVSRFFKCEKGVREGEHLSPILFSMYVNDLYKYLISKDCKGLSVPFEDDNKKLYYLMLPIVMYADDSVIFGTNKKSLQKSLDEYAKYCRDWKLDINVDKTKILCFGRKHKNVFTINNEVIENVDVFKYLGVLFSKNGRFEKAKIENINKARRGMYSLRKSFREKHIPIDCQLDLIEKTIDPILLYGCEIWGVGNIDIIERFRLKIIKQVMGIRPSTPTYMVYGETGKLPLKYIINKRIISFWGNMLNSKSCKLSFILYKCMLQSKELKTTNNLWSNHVRDILNNTGFSYIWLNQKCQKSDINRIKQRLEDQGIQSMYADMKSNESNKGKQYGYLKPEWKAEHYLSTLDQNSIKSLIRFRTSNHKLPVETGRYTNTPYARRMCNSCQHELGDEMHYVLICPLMAKYREKYIDQYYYNKPSMLKFLQLMGSKSVTELQNLSILTDKIMRTVTM